MPELRCPHCQKVFTVNEEEFASIANQVRTKEFEAEVQQRLDREKERFAAEEKARIAEAKAKHDAELAQKATEILKLKGDLDAIASKKDLEYKDRLAEKERVISDLKSQNAIALIKEQQKAEKALQDKERELEQEKSQAKLAESSFALEKQTIENEYKAQVSFLQGEIERYKDMKARLSTKMVGETLEQHCSNVFEMELRPLMPNAYFDKDNDSSQGSKGDFIFRDYEDGEEYVSIMFEMKNEMEGTASKHKNEDFFKKLDADRTSKKCEYAVLVSLLEADSELYNSGIVDVSHKYPKMFVIRPQFFQAIIRILVNAEKKASSYKRQLATICQQDRDFKLFEAKVQTLADGIRNDYRLGELNFKNAIKEIDTTISKLTAVKKELETSIKHLKWANDKAQDMIDIKSLTKETPSIRAEWEDARKQLQNPDEQ